MKRTIKSYKLFESSIDSFFELVKSNFQELEDLGIVHNYTYGKDGVVLKGPNIETINKFYGKESVWLKSVQENNNCIIISLKLPINKNEKVDQEGIKIFDDILSINSRLSSDGYKVEYDLAGSHVNYKPMEVIIYKK